MWNGGAWRWKECTPPDAYLRKPQKEGAEKRSPDPGRMLEPGGMKKDHLTMETQREDEEARGDSSCRWQLKSLNTAMHERHWEEKKKPELNRTGSEGMPLCLLRTTGLQLLACGCSLEPHLLWKSQPCQQRWQQFPEQQNNWKSEGDICKLGAWVGRDLQAERDFIWIPCWPLMSCMHGRPTEKAERAQEMIGYICKNPVSLDKVTLPPMLKKEVSALKKASAAEKAETSIQRVGEPQI